MKFIVVIVILLALLVLAMRVRSVLEIVKFNRARGRPWFAEPTAQERRDDILGKRRKRKQ